MRGSAIYISVCFAFAVVLVWIPVSCCSRHGGTSKNTPRSVVPAHSSMASVTVGTSTNDATYLEGLIRSLATRTRTHEESSYIYDHAKEAIPMIIRIQQDIAEDSQLCSLLVDCAGVDGRMLPEGAVNVFPELRIAVTSAVSFLREANTNAPREDESDSDMVLSAWSRDFLIRVGSDAVPIIAEAIRNGGLAATNEAQNILQAIDDVAKGIKTLKEAIGDVPRERYP